LLKNQEQESKPQFAETVKQSIQEEVSKDQDIKHISGTASPASY